MKQRYKAEQREFNSYQREYLDRKERVKAFYNAPKKMKPLHIILFRASKNEMQSSMDYMEENQKLS